MTVATFLVGLPASGKSTWRETSRSDSYVASSDDFIEAIARDAKKTYNEVFKEAISPATRHFDHMVFHAIAENKSVIVDRTNLTVDSRRKVLIKIPTSWKKVAIVFKCQDFEVWRDRLMNRPGKLIPAGVIMSMMSRYQKPTPEEGFDEIVRYFT